jgi:hypothetical protein
VHQVVIYIRESNEQAVTARMNTMREWLDHRRVEPSTFRYIFEPSGFVFQVDFKVKEEAASFAKEFGGCVMPGSTARKFAA